MSLGDKNIEVKKSTSVDFCPIGIWHIFTTILERESLWGLVHYTIPDYIL
jgi:hypothetical protein